MFKRSIKPLLEEALKRSPVILLNGARQVGKTTLALEFFEEKNYSYISFDDELTYLQAKKDKIGFISSLQKPVIIDEIQRIPEIFRTIKSDVDKNRHPGRYLLTGSANPLLIPKLGDSLAGRMEVIDLMPLSQGEIYNHEEKFLDIIFSNKDLISPKNSLSRQELIERIIVGGYPAVQSYDGHLIQEKNRMFWMRNYINLILQRDIRDLSHIEKLAEIPNLLALLASQASGLMNVASLSRDSGIAVKTLHRYLALLETIFLIYTQPAWHRNLTLRTVKAPKIYLGDTRLLSYLLDISVENILKDGIYTGRIVENFVVNELRKQATWSKKEIKFYHFRTSTGEEIDIILQDRAGNIIGIEIKSNFKVTHNDFKGLKYLKERAKDKFLKGIILYAGTQTLPFGEDLFVMPINSLWEQITSD